MADESLPMRPLTTGELLDSAVAVLRRRPVRLLGIGLALAGAEQAVLFPLRHHLLTDAHDYTEVLFRPSTFMALVLLIAVGLGCEAGIVALLGAVAARPARDLLVADLPGMESMVVGGRRPVAAVALSGIIGVAGFLTFYLGGVPWVLWFMLTGLITPTLMTDAYARAGAAPRRIGVARAFGRGVALAARSGVRAGRIRLFGYLIWWGIRLLIAYAGTFALAGLLELSSDTAVNVLGYVLWTGINAVAYAMIACLDATLHLETRMRIEGLDIMLSRALRRGLPIDAALAVPR